MSNRCEICGSDNIRGGSWTPDRCMNCGASEMFTTWECDYKARPTIEEIRQRSGYYLKDGQPCDHPGCLNHTTHPCEGCGRIGGTKRGY